MQRSKILPIMTFFVLVLAFGCNEDSLDPQGLASNENAVNQFARASQLYFRGRLTVALEEFNGVIYRYPDSPVSSDARLAVRRLESDLADEQSTDVVSNVSSISARVAVVGKPAVNPSILRVTSHIRSLGASASEIVDDQAPELTTVFYNQGHQAEATLVTDSLVKWLSHPEIVACNQGDDLISAVASGFDIMVIVGNDAVFVMSSQEGF